ncbi:PAS domain-containing protein [bacterium]|nr:PAS domain-containing protein [bacterium]
MWIAIAIIGLIAAAVLQVVWQRKYRSLKRREGELSRQNEALDQAIKVEQKEAEQRQSALFDSMVEGVLILDAQDQILMMNASFRRFFNVQGEVAGKTIIQALRHHELQELVERLPAAGRITEFEIETNALRGRSLQMNAVALTGAAGRGGAMLVFHDLTRIKQLENMRRDFVANVSHELRTPLSMIKGYVETLLDGAKDDPNVAVKFLKTIEKHADRLMFLIEDLLTISSLESGQVAMNMQPVALAGLVERVIEELKDRAAARQAIVTSEVSDEQIIHADPARIQQVFVNLIDNAIKYGKQGGRIEVKVSTTEDPQRIKLSVIDDGPGIPPEAAERVFERFYRVDKARSREQGGTGLGLAIVKHIVQAHGGEVWVESSPSKGTVFYFTLQTASLVS